MNIHELSPVVGSTHVGKRKGRGHATGNGKTAGRGHKGPRRPAAAAASASASKAARCLWPAASRSAASTTSLQTARERERLRSGEV